ncbi:MAG: histidine kinase, partial [Hyphomicrobiales bacterium]|nr:histidine kinase [Hyphomicrobiales bacterium]
VLVSADASQMLAMAIYELATNAVKYGALSNDTGQVEIAWSVSGAKDSQTFTLRWREIDGPLIAKP